MMSVLKNLFLPIAAVMALFLATTTTNAQQLKAIPRRMRNEGVGQRRFELLEESMSRKAATAAHVLDTARLLKMDDNSMSMLLSVPMLEEADMSMSMWTIDYDELEQSVVKEETAVREADLLAAYKKDVVKMNSSSGSYSTGGNSVVLMLLFFLCWAM